MHLIRMIIIILTLCLLSGPTLADSITLTPDGSHSNQEQINDALKEYEVVFLGPGVYPADGPINIKASGRTLSGDKNAIIQVYEKSNQWFVGPVGIINCRGTYDDITIENIQIDGNLNKLPRSYADYNGGDHNAERAIYFQGDSKRFMNNIVVRNVQIYDCYSDGIHIQFANNVNCHNNFISNCQHSGIFYVSVTNGVIQNNDVAGITSDCVRLDNCVNNVVTGNVLYSYTGSGSNGAYQGGQNSIQIADQGFSHGGGSSKPTHTTNIEVYGNTFTNTGLRAVWLDSTGKGYENVYIHDNKFLDTKEFTTNGKSVEITGIDPSQPISYTNPPSKETSRRIFSSIFDIFSMDFVTQASGNDTVILPKGVKEIPSEAIGTIKQYDQGNLSYTLVSVPTVGLSEVRYEVNGKEAVHTLMLGEKQGSKIVFSNCSIWSGDFDRIGDSLYLEGVVEPEDIEVTCVSPVNEFKPILEVEQVETPNRFFHPILKFVFMVIFGAIGFIYLNLKFAF